MRSATSRDTISCASVKVFIRNTSPALSPPSSGTRTLNIEARMGSPNARQFGKRIETRSEGHDPPPAIEDWKLQRVFRHYPTCPKSSFNRPKAQPKAGNTDLFD